MGLQEISTSEILMICRTINSYSTLFDWMNDEPFYIDEDEPDTKYLPSTSPMLGFAVMPMFVNDGVLSHFKQKYGGNADVMSFINTQSSLCEEKGFEFKIEWTLRYFKEKKFFKTIYAIQSNLSPIVGNTGVNLGFYKGKTPSDPIHDMFSELR